MNGSEILTMVSALAVTGPLAWFFFAPRKSQRAAVEDGARWWR